MNISSAAEPYINVTLNKCHLSLQRECLLQEYVFHIHPWQPLKIRSGNFFSRKIMLDSIN